jgi:hypothetical protein
LSQRHNCNRGGHDGRLDNRGFEIRRGAAQFPYSNGGKACRLQLQPPPGVPARTGQGEQHQVAIRDARPLIGQLSLDKEGFVLLHHQTAVKNFYDEHEIASVYYPECERVIKEATGAARVVAFDHIVRNAAMSAKGNTIKIPAKRVHDDYTAWSAPQRVRDLMGEEAEELLKHRFAIINLWRPIRGPVLESPLALCDAQSLSEENLVASDLKYPDRTGETYSITYNPTRGTTTSRRCSPTKRC